MFEDRETWRFINTFAPWLSAIGTLIAVIVSLYLALRASRLDLRIFAAIVKIVYQDDFRTEAPEYLQIRVVNHGRTAVVSGFGWSRWGSWKKRTWVIVPPVAVGTTHFPQKLEFGEEASIYLPTATFDKDHELFLQELKSSWFPRLSVRLLRIVVFASTGQKFRIFPDVYVRKFLLDRASDVAPKRSTSHT